MVIFSLKSYKRGRRCVYIWSYFLKILHEGQIEFENLIFKRIMAGNNLDGNYPQNNTGPIRIYFFFKRGKQTGKMLLSFKYFLHFKNTSLELITNL